MLTVLAPAKVNLTLEVLSKRPDGFHEIRSVAQTVNLCDKLHFQRGNGLEFRCADSSWVPEMSLVSKAADLLQEIGGASEGAIITVDKYIPLVSGLSGDSSDAAATLRGLNRLWELSLPQEELMRLAAQLGSDVPFFLSGGTALLEGRGELVTPLPPFPKTWVILMLPPVPRLHGKTGRLYAGIRTEHFTDGQITERLVNQLTRGRGMKTSTLFNVFDEVAPGGFEELSIYWEQFLKAGAREVQLAGSGPVLFTLTQDKAQAEKIYQSLEQQNLESYLTHTLAAIDYMG